MINYQLPWKRIRHSISQTKSEDYKKNKKTHISKNHAKKVLKP